MQSRHRAIKKYSITERQKKMLRAQDCTLELTPFVCMYLRSAERAVRAYSIQGHRDCGRQQKWLLMARGGTHSTLSPGKLLCRIRFMVNRSFSGLLT